MESHVIADAHIYDRHIPIVKEIIERVLIPKFEIDKDIDDFYKFTVSSFNVDNYRYHALDKNSSRRIMEGI